MIDGFAGLWCVNGYGHGIVGRCHEQMRELPYATAILAWAPNLQSACCRAGRRAPGDLNHIFFTLGVRCGEPVTSSAIITT